jgi:hypothetical protein
MDKKKAGLGALVLLALGAVAFGASDANADDDVTPPDPDDEPTIDPIDFDPYVEPPPPPPPPGVCDYSGCPAFDATHKSAIYYRQRLQILGYPIIPNGNPISPGSRQVWRDFQRHYNRVRSGNGLAGPAQLRIVQGAVLALAEVKTSSKLAEDGLPGNSTLAALERAHRLVNTIGLAWEQCVALS